MRSVQDSESLFRDQLEKATKSLIKKDDHISELIEEGRDQYTFGWSHARFDTLRQYCNDKLVDKEVEDNYFYDAEDEEDEGRLDKVVEVATHQANGEEAATKESQEDAKEIADGEGKKKDE